MPTEVREHEEKSHSARYLVLIFLVLVAMCGVFFSAGFIVGHNEHSLHASPSTELINAPGAAPPTVNPPADDSLQDPGAVHGAPNTAPDNVILSPGATDAPPGATPQPDQVAPTTESPSTQDAPPPAPQPAAVAGQGITLQVVASHTRGDAEKVVAVLKDKNYPVFLLTPEEAHASDQLFRVLVGPFKNRTESDKVRDRLKEDGFKPFIRK